ncbi:hypothetical protein PBI_CAMILLE_53 [Microbacterium phage Camille]|nr:hypothetical protein PBI_CAMILLE_53 [Microbacterium phage Camille]
MSDTPFTRPCDGNCEEGSSPHTGHLTAAGRARYFAGFPRTDQNLFFDATDPSMVLGELAGYTSLCWNEGPEGRIFDSERASYAVDQALARLNELGVILPEANKEKI